MLKAALILLAFVTTAVAQIPSSSPALDPDFVILQPKEEFAGRYANQTVGSVIHTVAPLRWNIPNGGVFLNNVDTAGYSPFEIENYQPSGPFLLGQNFSLYDKAAFKINGLRDPVMIFTRGKNEFPVMAGKALDWLRTPFLYFYFPDTNGNYQDSIYTFTTKAFLLGGYGPSTGWASVDVNKDGFDDFFGVEEFDEEFSDSTSIGLWYSNDIVFKNDTLKPGGMPIITSSQEWSIPNRMRWPMETGDFDRDGVVDLCYITDNRVLTIIFGKLANQRWDIDTIITLPDSSIRSYLFMDFLHEDKIKDLLIGTADTIFCFSGHKLNFLRHGFLYEDADFKLPSPGKLDPANWGQSNEFIGYAYHLWDAGDVNGSGVHSLATSADKLTGTLSGIPFFIVYSGGRAADEKIDAIYAQPSGIYNGFGNMDSVNTGARPTGLIVGDLSYSAGATGKIWYFLGDKNIPHKPNPKWSVNTHVSSTLTLDVRHSSGNLNISIGTSGYSSGKISVRDVLGRVVYERGVDYEAGTGRHVTIRTSGLAGGMHIVTYEQDGETISKKIMILGYTHGEAGKQLLPERYLLAPYLPEASLWAESTYTSRLWEQYTYSAEQRKELLELKRERSRISPEEYTKRLQTILHKHDKIFVQAP